MLCSIFSSVCIALTASNRINLEIFKPPWLQSSYESLTNFAIYGYIFCFLWNVIGIEPFYMYYHDLSSVRFTIEGGGFLHAIMFTSQNLPYSVYNSAVIKDIIVWTSSSPCYSTQQTQVIYRTRQVRTLLTSCYCSDHQFQAWAGSV